MSRPILQACAAEDLPALRELSITTFREAFEADNDPADFKVYLQKAFSSQQLRSELEHPLTRFFFVIEQGEIAGYCKLNWGEAQTELKEAKGMELERIYITAAYQGSGLGSWLLLEICDLARNKGMEYLWLGVWERNPGAIRFYERHGFVTFGKHPYYIGSDRQMDWMMRLDLHGNAQAQKL